MKILVVGNDGLDLSLRQYGFSVTSDPGDEIFAVVSSSANHEVLPDGHPIYLLSSGGMTDWAAKKARQDAIFFGSVEEIMPLLKPPPKEVIPDKTTQDSLVIATYANKGGVGKTTAANSLALTLADQGINTVICDFDFGGANLAGFYNLKGTFRNYLNGNALECLVKINNNLYLLPSPTDIIPSQVKEEHLETALAQLRERFSVVMCDTCPSPWTKDYMSGVFSNTDLIYAIVNQSKFSIEETKVYVPQLIYMEANIENIRIILNQYDPKLVSVKEVEKCFNSGLKKEIKKRPKVTAMIPHDWQQVNQATYKGQLANAEVWDRICREILDKLGAAQSTSEPAKKANKVLGFLKIKRRR